MTLLTVHKVMIATAIAFCALFAVRAGYLSANEGGSVQILFLVLSAAGAIALTVYLRWLRSKGRRLEAAANSRSSRRDN